MEEAPSSERSDPTWLEKVHALNGVLASVSVPYAFGGAIALNYHRDPRSTSDVDIDIFVRPELADSSLMALDGLFLVPELDRARQQIANDGQTRLLWGSTFVDLFYANTDFHDSMAVRIQWQDLEGDQIPVLSIEDLLTCKALFNRPKDWLDIAAVVDHEGDQLDKAYIERWVIYFLAPDDPVTARLRSALG